jgi:pilus assembly protein CpaE
LDKIGYKNPDVLIINTHKVTQVIIDFIERIYITKQGCAIILIANELNIDEMSKVLEAGANKALCAPIDFKELSDSIILSFNREKTRISKNQAVDKTSFLSKVISVFGTKGGVGKTTLAVNLAVSLAKARKKLAILDLDLQFGDVGIFLDIDTADTIVELVQDNSDLDINTIKSYMVIHSTGINVLLAPKSPELAELVNSKSVEKIINTLKNYYDYIIIDNPPAFNDISLVALENSSAVLFVTNLDISSLKNTRVSFDILSSLGMLEKVLTVVNKDGISTIKTKDAKKILDKDIFSIISNDNRVAVKALNRGVPIVLDSPKSVVSSAINSLAYKILDNIK